mmetsp:Transcript_35744/g.101160  ORF Transcript_35744/g.101160 Transcript_35744/m.101160 type:complete len:686 (-) Transcript_35744:264-2321(-)
MAARFPKSASKHNLATGSSTGTRSADHREYPTRAEDYELLDECGQGAAGKVWRALCKPPNSIVAVKLLDLENMSCNLEEIIREAQIMKLVNHENILSLHCSFVHQSDLWMVMPYVKGGSVLNIMKFAHPQGLEEPIIATILREVLKALDYVHKQGAIHRDVKAGNILIGNHGEVKLADFGVAATMDRSGEGKRQTFVGTPCWMAPEVMEQEHGYDSKADIWSFGITVLELAHGMAPFAKSPPMKVLMMTLRQPPPQLQATGEKHFSKEMQQLVGLCLVKDPKKRPTAARLLEHRFFKGAQDSAYLMKHLLADLPPLTERVKQLRAQKGPGGIAEKRQAIDKSNEEYVKGVSSWNFDVADLKAQAAMEPDPDGGWDFDVASSDPQGNADAVNEGLQPSADGAASSLASATAAALVGAGAAALALDVPGDNSTTSPNLTSPSGPTADSPFNSTKVPREGERKGRFQIVQADANLPPASPTSSMEFADILTAKTPGKAEDKKDTTGAAGVAGMTLQRAGSSQDLDGPHKKKPSRFNIVSSEESGLPPKPSQSSSSIHRASSAANVSENQGGGAGAAGRSRLEAVLPHLEMMLKVHQKQGEELHTIVNAMAQASIGKPEALQRLTSQSPNVHLERLLPSDSNQVASYRRQIDRLTARVKELEEDKSRLKHDYDKLRQKLERSQKALLAD